MNKISVGYDSVSQARRGYALLPVLPVAGPDISEISVVDRVQNSCTLVDAHPPSSTSTLLFLQWMDSGVSDPTLSTSIKLDYRL